MDIWNDVDARLYNLQRNIMNKLKELEHERDAERLENNALVMFEGQGFLDSLERSGLVVNVFIAGESCLKLDDDAMEDIRDGFCDTTVNHLPSVIFKICEILENRYDFSASGTIDHRQQKTVVHTLADKAFDIIGAGDNHVLQFITGTKAVHHECVCIWRQLNPEMDLIERLRSIVSGPSALPFHCE